MGKHLLVVLLAFVGAAMAEGVYKWVDEQGRTVYSDKPPPGRAARQIDVPAEPGPKAGETEPHERQTAEEKRTRKAPQEVLGTLSVGFATVGGAADFPQPPFKLTLVIRSLERAMDSRLDVDDPAPEWRRDSSNAVSTHQDFSFLLGPGGYELVAVEAAAPSLSDSPVLFPATARRFVVPEGKCVYIGRIYFVFHRLPPLPFAQSQELATKLADKAGKQEFLLHYLPKGALIPWEFGVDTPAAGSSGEDTQPGQRALARARERGCAIRPAGS